MRQWLADETGWTLAQVDEMTLQDYTDWLSFREAKQKAQPTPRTPARGKGRRRRR